MNIKAVVTDIEGTTSSLSFVKDVLFPYARQQMAVFIQDNKDDEQVTSLLADVNAEAGKQLTIDEAIDQLKQWIDEDKKITPLKALQGLIWEHGYRNGDFHGHIYADACEQLKQWYAQGVRLYVYSSGSVYAQKLLFAHTEYGDLTPLFSGYFDTQVGQKRDADSYRHIVSAIAMEATDILFLSDIREELDAAREAGMQTTWLVRDGDLDKAAAHRQVSDFGEIGIES